MQVFQPQNQELTEKQKTSISLLDLSYQAKKLEEVLTSLDRLLSAELITTIECQMKADKCIEDFFDYVQKGGEGY